MIEQIFTSFGEVFTAVDGWFVEFNEACGTYAIVIGVIAIMIFFRMIIYPLFGSVGNGGLSDSVHSSPGLPVLNDTALNSGKYTPTVHSLGVSGSTAVQSSGFVPAAYKDMDNGKPR